MVRDLKITFKKHHDAELDPTLENEGDVSNEEDE